MPRKGLNDCSTDVVVSVQSWAVRLSNLDASSHFVGRRVDVFLDLRVERWSSLEVRDFQCELYCSSVRKLGLFRKG
jgi:hypothetical protein